MAKLRRGVRQVRDVPKPRCIVIAGPNGAGKTTFARTYLLQDTSIVRFINADLIAGGLSPLRPQLAAVAAGRLVLQEIERLSQSSVDFAFESTLSGLTYVRRLQKLKKLSYQIEIVYLRLASSQLALQRVAARVKQGGHTVLARDVLRRFDRSWDNFQNSYRLLADRWAVYENSGDSPKLIERSL
jgi:predicted ABC-type ATPase